MADIIDVYSENPEEDIWDRLITLTYKENVEKFIKREDSNISLPLLDSLTPIITSSIAQSKEYFQASKTVTLYTSPLMLYYGFVNLLYGVGHYLERNVLNIDNHGLNLEKPLIFDSTKKIGDINISITNSTKGGFYQYLNLFDKKKLTNHIRGYSIKEIFGSIPELKDDYESCYPTEKPFVIPITPIAKREISYDEINLSDTLKLGNNFYDYVYDYKDNYQLPQTGKDKHILFRKLNFNHTFLETISGNKYLGIVHTKNNKDYYFSILINMFLGLYALGSLSRYKPDIWNNFINTDSTGEKLLIEKFIKLCRRYIPNFLLNIVYEKKFNFISNVTNSIDERHIYTKDDLEKIIKEILNKKGLSQ
jgi:hypothetical protein